MVGKEGRCFSKGRSPLLRKVLLGSIHNLVRVVQDGANI